MVTLLYHSKQIGYICKRIADTNPEKLRAVCDKTLPNAMMDYGTIVRWDSVHPLGAHKTINTAEAVTLSRNKHDSRFKLLDLCPTTWDDASYLEYPCLIRPKKHFAAHKFFVVKTKLEAKRAIKRCGRGWYASPLIDKKLEYRVFVLNGKAFKMVRRFHTDPNQVAWNIANGGTSVRIMKESWPANVATIAVEAGKLLGLDWYAADVIVDQAGKPYVLELNTAPGLARDLTITNLAKLFVKCGA